ncbi:MAG: metal ABC transporter ATP-binding protein [Paracoccaceae bacterium]|nr:metal ABC transporter ATP-binding protein [Paracoccaceae bacterium]
MLIEVTDLNVRYGAKTVLKNLHLFLNRGEIVTIVGPNGSGKTTLFKAIIGTAPISSGKIKLKDNLKMGYVPQQLNIDHSLPMTVGRFLLLAQQKNQKAFEKALEIVGAKDLLNRQIYNLSGGEMQRVLLAKAIINEPDVLLLDEATRGLDQSGSAAFYRKIENIRNDLDCSVLMISHDLHVVMGASDRVICLNGHICCEGAPKSVATSPEYKALFGSDVDGTFALYRHSHDHNHHTENEKL